MNMQSPHVSLRAALYLRQSLDRAEGIETQRKRCSDLATGRGWSIIDTFEDNETKYPTSGVLRSMFSTSKTSFIGGSHVLMDQLAGRADQAQLATGGFVLMAHITGPSGASWFLVAMINNVDGSVVNDKLEVTNAEHVDLENLRVAGRVNLAEWLGGATD